MSNIDINREEVLSMRNYIIDALEVGAPLQVVLRTVVHRFGVARMAGMAGLDPRKVEVAIDPRKRVEIEVLGQLLALFELKLGVTGVQPLSDISS